MYRISTIAIIATTACFSGCSDKSERPKQHILGAVHAARKSQVIQQIDSQMARVANKLGNKGGILVPQVTDEDRKVGKEANTCIAGYFHEQELTPAVTEMITEMIASARNLYAEDVAAFDQAVDGICKVDASFPNFSIYEFIRANIEILTNDLFDIDADTARIGIQMALACASDKTKCRVIASKTFGLLSIKDKIISLISLQGNTWVRDIKLVFVPLYVLFNHSSIPHEYRGILTALIGGLAGLAEAIEADPSSAEAIMQDLGSRIQQTPEEESAFINIQNHFVTITRSLGVDSTLPMIR